MFNKSEYMKKRYQIKREQILAYHKKHREDHPAYRLYQLEYNRMWRKKNAEKYKAYQKQYREKNAERVRNTERIYKQNHKEVVESARARWRNRNPEKFEKLRKEWIRKWLQSEKGRAYMRSAAAARRALLKAQFVEHIDYKEFYEQSNKRCHYCNKPLKFEEVHIDHYIPITKGGLHVRENLRISCPPCNIRKSNKLPADTSSEALQHSLHTPRSAARPH